MAKYPCIGYKQKDYRGNVLGRFQVSFVDRKTYDDFVMYLRDGLKLIVDDNLVANSASQSIGDSFASQNWFEPSQTENNNSQCDNRSFTRNLEANFQGSMNIQKQEIHRSQTFAIPKLNVAISSKLIPTKRNHTSCDFYDQKQNSKNEQSKVFAKDQFREFLDECGTRKNSEMITIDEQEHPYASSTPQKSQHHPQQLPPNDKFDVSHLKLSQSQDIPDDSQNVYSNTRSNTNYNNGPIKNADIKYCRCGSGNTAQSLTVVAGKVLCIICGKQGMDTLTLDNWSINELQNIPKVNSNDWPNYITNALPSQSKPQVLTPNATPEKTSNHSNANSQLWCERENESIGNLQPEPTIADIFKMTNENQREFIVLALKDPLFVKLVKRVDTILGQKSG